MYVSENGKHNSLNIHCCSRRLSGWYQNYYHPVTSRVLPPLLKLCTRCYQIWAIFTNFMFGVTPNNTIVTSYGGQLEHAV